MTKCEVFLNYFDELVKGKEMPSDVQEFYNLLRDTQDDFVNKPAFTENGLMILEYLQSIETKALKAKDIADGLKISSRQVSGAMRKLVADGYVEKFGQNPVIYAITETGRNFNINEYKENN